MKPNNARTLLGGPNQALRAGTTSRSTLHNENPLRTASESLNSQDPGAAEYMSTLRTEWTKSEGSRVERLLEDAFDSFKPIAWSRPANLNDVNVELQRTGRTRQALIYPETDIAGVAEAIQQTHPRVVKLDHPAKAAIVEKAELIVLGCGAFASLWSQPSNEPVTNWSLDYYGRPSDEVLNTARAILSRKPPVHSAEQEFETDEILHLFGQQVADLIGWSVVVAPIQAVMSIRPKAREIVIRHGVKVTSSELQRLWVHEVGGHVIRTINAKQSGGSLAQLKLGRGSTSTEEGLAVWWEHHLGAQQDSVMRRYAARAIAVDIALKSGAADVMDELTPVVGTAEAAAITMRVKRGMSNAEAPGAFTKDHSYLSGYIAVQEFLNAHPELLPALMATKWDLGMTSLAQQLIDERVLIPGRMPWEVLNGFASPINR